MLLLEVMYGIYEYSKLGLEISRIPAVLQWQYRSNTSHWTLDRKCQWLDV